MLMLQCSWASRYVFVTNQVVTMFLHILGLLSIMFLLLIKLQQIFYIYVGFWALTLCVFVINQVVTTFLQILGLLNIIFLLLIKLQQLFNIYLGFFALFLCC